MNEDDKTQELTDALATILNDINFVKKIAAEAFSCGNFEVARTARIRLAALNADAAVKLDDLAIARAAKQTEVARKRLGL